MHCNDAERWLLGYAPYFKSTVLVRGLHPFIHHIDPVLSSFFSAVIIYHTVAKSFRCKNWEHQCELIAAFFVVVVVHTASKLHMNPQI